MTQTQLRKILQKNLRNVYQEQSTNTTTLRLYVVLVQERVIRENDRGQRRNICESHKPLTRTLRNSATRVTEGVVRVVLTQDNALERCQNGKIYDSLLLCNPTSHSQLGGTPILLERKRTRSDLHVHQFWQVCSITPTQHTHSQTRRLSNHGNNTTRSESSSDSAVLIHHSPPPQPLFNSKSAW